MNALRRVGPAPSCDRGCWCRGRRYTCPGCLRFVPWCFGAADDLERLCDDCWAAAHGETGVAA